METVQTSLMKRLEERSARVAVLGLGYVGLPLAVVFAEAGFAVTGIDPDERKVAALCRGESYIRDVPTEQVAPPGRSRQPAGHHRFRRPGRGGCGLHLRPHPPAQNRRPGPVLYRLGHRSAGPLRARRDGGRAGIHHLPGHHPRAGPAPPDRRQRADGGRGPVHRLLPRAGRPRADGLDHPEHPQSGGRDHPGLLGGGRRLVCPGAGRRSCRSPRPKWPRWPSCWRTPSA